MNLLATNSFNKSYSFSFASMLFLLCSCKAQMASQADSQPRSSTEFLDASDYHQFRRGLHNSKRQFEQTKKGRVAFLGGSITYNPGWRDSVCQYLVQRFPETKFDFIAAGIPSMGTTPAAFRLERDVISHGKVDLLLEEAAVNDATNGRSDTEQIRAMEGLIRHLLLDNPSMDIVMMHFVDPDKMKDYRSDTEPRVITNHNAVAEHYQIPTINLAREVTERIDNGEFTWEDDFKDLHPSPFGQGVYARSIIQFLEGSFAENSSMGGSRTAHEFPSPLDKFSYSNGYLVDVTHASLDGGWNISESWQPSDDVGTRPNYTDVPFLLSERIGSTLTFNFEGSAVGVVVAAGPDAGTIEYRIDEEDWQQLNLFTRWSHFIHLPWYYTLASELSEDPHILELRISSTKDERSKGHACRIRYFYVNGH